MPHPNYPGWEGKPPYRMVHLVERPQRRPPAGHHRFAGLSGELELTWRVLRPLHVASGYQDLRTEGGRDVVVAPLPTVWRGGQRQRVIPATSLKGVVRSVAEAMSPSCVVIAGRDVRGRLPRESQACRDAARLCPACRVFGALGYRGHVYFEDLTVPDAAVQLTRMYQLWSPKPAKYLRGGRVAGRKFYRHGEPQPGGDYREAVKEGTELVGRIGFSGLGEGELGLLLAALGLDPDRGFALKVGGGKPLGFGSVRVRLVRASYGRGVGRWAGPLAAREGPEVDGWIRECRAAATREGLLLESLVQEVAGVLTERDLKEPSPGKQAY